MLKMGAYVITTKFRKPLLASCKKRLVVTSDKPMSSIRNQVLKNSSEKFRFVVQSSSNKPFWHQTKCIKVLVVRTSQTLGFVCLLCFTKILSN